MGEGVELKVLEDHLTEAFLNYLRQIRLHCHDEAALPLIKTFAKAFRELLLPEYVLKVRVVE